MGDILMKPDIVSHQVNMKFINQDLVGGKAYNLYLLKKIGMQIPPWLVVTKNVFEKAMIPYKIRLEELLSSINFTDASRIPAICSQIHDLIKKVEIDEMLNRSLIRKIKSLSSDEILFAVRSSAIGEDSKEKSYAGQMDSFLNVPADKIKTTVKKVWMSAFLPRVLLYRKQLGENLSIMPVAVIVQQMVPAEKSGILFSRDPETGEKVSIISAGYGYGEGIVSNLVESDTYRVNRSGNPVQTKIEIKQNRIGIDKELGEGTRIEKVSNEFKLSQVLNKEQIIRLHKTAIRLEIYFDRAQDIEWSFDKQGNLYILQSRPVIFNKNLEYRVWENSNIVESYPGITQPLTFSFIRRGYEICFKTAAFELVPFKKPLKPYTHIFKNMLGILKGRLYYNLLNWYQMLSFLPAFDKRRKAWDQMIGISDRIPYDAQKLSIVFKVLSYFKVLKLILMVHTTASKFSKHFDHSFPGFKQKDYSNKSSHELIKIFNEIEIKLGGFWHLTLYNDLSAMTYYEFLRQLCKKWKLDKLENLHNDLFCGTREVESVKPLRSLMRISKIIKENSKYLNLFNNTENLQIWNTIQQQTDYNNLHSVISEHLDNFGDRTLEELKLERPTLREEPEHLIGLLKKVIQNHHKTTCEGNRNEDMDKVVDTTLRNPLKSFLFDFVLKRARFAVATRESMRLARARLYGVVRRIFLQLGRILAEEGILQQEEDVFYLTVEELSDFIEGSATTVNLKDLVSIRKKEYENYRRDEQVSEKIETNGIPYLNPIHTNNSGISDKKYLKGVGCSSGSTTGKARIIKDPNFEISTDNYILITRSTDPGWVFLMMRSKGIVVEKGSVLSHTAIIGRELGIPTIVGAEAATQIIPDNCNLQMNGRTGVVQWQ
jgi:pyruvate,water dikinase